MSTRESCFAILCSFDETEDDAFCAKLLKEADADDYDDVITIEDFADELGVKLL